MQEKNIEKKTVRTAARALAGLSLAIATGLCFFAPIASATPKDSAAAAFEARAASAAKAQSAPNKAIGANGAGAVSVAGVQVCAAGEQKGLIAYEYVDPVSLEQGFGNAFACNQPDAFDTEEGLMALKNAIQEDLAKKIHSRYLGGKSTKEESPTVVIVSVIKLKR